MKINIYCENIKLQKYYEQALSEYTKRLSAFCKINFYNYFESSVNQSDYIIVVDTKSTLISSEELADKIKQITTYINSTISFIITSENISTINIEKYDDTFSISRFDISNEFMQIVIAEQIYRAFTIINGKKYHK